MEGLRVIDNLEVDRLRKENAAKEEEKRQRKAAKVARASGEQGVVVGCAGGVAR